MVKKSILFTIVLCLFACINILGKKFICGEQLSSIGKEYTHSVDESKMLPRTILGCTLGNTGIATAKKILKSKGIIAKEATEDGCACLYAEKKIIFHNKEWDGIMFLFNGGSLIRVWIYSKKVDKNFSRMLIKQYGDNYFRQTDFNVYINDDKTSFKYEISESTPEWSSSALTITDYSRNELLPRHKDRIESPFR